MTQVVDQQLYIIQANSGSACQCSRWLLDDPQSSVAANQGKQRLKYEGQMYKFPCWKVIVTNPGNSRYFSYKIYYYFKHFIVLIFKLVRRWQNNVYGYLVLNKVTEDNCIMLCMWLINSVSLYDGMYWKKSQTWVKLGNGKLVQWNVIKIKCL